MAIYRTVSQYFWTDTKVVDMFTPEDKYFMLYLLTNPHTTLLGCYEISIKQISDEIGYTRDSVYSLLSRFRDQYNIIDYSETDKEILVKNWYKYNWAKSPKVLAAIKKFRDMVKCDKFKTYLDEKIAERFATGNSITDNNNSIQGERTATGISIDYGYGIDMVSGGKNAPLPPKKAYGVYKNVLLTDEEFESFKSVYATEYEHKIDRLSVYVKQSGKNYNNHYAVLVEWAKEDETKQAGQKPQMSSFDTNSFYEAAINRAYNQKQD